MSELREIVLRIRQEHPGVARAVVIDRFVGEVRDYRPELHEEAIRECGEVHLAWWERQRNHSGFRSYKGERDGVQLSLPLLDHRFDEAERVVERELRNAHGALGRAEYDQFALRLAYERARERGLEPDQLTERTLREFTDEAEVAAAWAAR